MLLHGAVTITPMPRTVFTVAAGVLFGSVLGLLLTVAGTTLAAVLAFWLVRLVGGRFAERHSHHRRWSGCALGSTTAGCSRWCRCG